MPEDLRYKQIEQVENYIAKIEENESASEMLKIIVGVEEVAEVSSLVLVISLGPFFSEANCSVLVQQEYKMYMEKDVVYMRCFQQDSVHELGIGIIRVLKRLKERFERHHFVIIQDQALDVATNCQVDTLQLQGKICTIYCKMGELTEAKVSRSVICADKRTAEKWIGKMARWKMQNKKTCFSSLSAGLPQAHPVFLVVTELVKTSLLKIINVLVGEPSAGKTTIVEGLTRKIIRGKVPIDLVNVKLINATPCCHGAGRLVGQYKFGGRSGGCVALLGVAKLVLGLVLGSYLVKILDQFPVGVLGVLLLFAGIALAMCSRDINSKEEICLFARCFTCWLKCST
ncbi:putative Sulfate transporter [Forsythia ovata]|uniref:Sulfate transporter n=1 Tax=Forsythia ovata TaxID=205694 RepID=A0ABD1X7Z3_9LAMI